MERAEAAQGRMAWAEGPECVGGRNLRAVTSSGAESTPRRKGAARKLDRATGPRALATAEGGERRGRCQGACSRPPEARAGSRSRLVPSSRCLAPPPNPSLKNPAPSVWSPGTRAALPSPVRHSVFAPGPLLFGVAGLSRELIST